MSTWNDEKHDESRVLADYYDHPREISYMSGDIPPWEHLAITLGSALDEIERLRALPTITDDMVGRAHSAVVEHLSANAGCVYAEDEGPDMLRTALEAALNPGEER